jgi:glycosyltransferase involved in cell wall biosynthesis
MVAWSRALASLGVLRVRLDDQLRQLAPAVVLTNGLKAHVLGALARTTCDAPVVWCAREGLEDRPLSRAILRLAGRRCDGVIAISRYVASEFRAVVPGPVPIHVVRNIVDLARVRPALPLPRDLVKAPGETWLGVVGALAPLKGQDVFVEAAARVAARAPGTRFLVVGGEPYRTAGRSGYAAGLVRRVQALGLVDRVRFLGERDDAPAVIANLDVLVQPNRGPEGLGRTILEAMACAVPVVSVDRWGPRELVRDEETGFLVPPGDVDALADRLVRLAGDPALRARMGAAGRRAILEHGDPAMLAHRFHAALAQSAGLAVPEPGVTAQGEAAGGR